MAPGTRIYFLFGPGDGCLERSVGPCFPLGSGYLVQPGWNFGDHLFLSAWDPLRLFFPVIFQGVGVGVGGWEQGVPITPAECGLQHIRVLPVLCYPRNMVIYHYPLIGVIFMVILLIFIIQN